MTQEERDALLTRAHQLPKEEYEAILIQALQTPAGKKVLRQAIQLAAAKAADRLPEGGVGWWLARRLAGLP